MTAQPQITCPPLWESPLATIRYDDAHELRPRERQAITTFIENRSNPRLRMRLDRLAEDHPLQRLLAPLHDALDLMPTRKLGRNAVVFIFLRDCLEADTTFWAWDHECWVHFIGRLSRAIEHQNHTHHGERQQMAAIAYLQGWFRDVVAPGAFRTELLARRVFGEAAIDEAIDWVVEPLRRWGYAANRRVRSCLCEALLRNESPHVEHLTTETLGRFRQDASVSKRSIYFQLARALAERGTITAPLPFAHDRLKAPRVAMTDGVSDEWVRWIERWKQTSTPEAPKNLTCQLYKMARWLGVHHKDILSPADWSTALGAEFVAAASRMRVGDYVVFERSGQPIGKPLAPRSKAQLITAVRRFFRDCHEWEWIPRRFDPGRSLAVPRSIRAMIGPKPRVIADDVWARLLWAGLHLEKEDLMQQRGTGQGYLYPLEYVHAIAIVWLFSGLRRDEISRLRVGCVRWQTPPGADIGTAVCILDVPVSKTATEFAKPVDSKVGQVIEIWERIRPEQPQTPDRKTGERVSLLFMYRGRAMRPALINESIIPMLCRKAGVPTSDARGAITSHRARTTIASQLFNSREPMSLFELQAWLGHRSLASTQHYVAVTPTRLAQAYTDAGYFERNVRAIEVLIDQDTLKEAVAAGEPWRYYDLGHGLCAYEFFDQCAHRMACARCDFYRPRESSLVQLIEAKENILRFLQEIPLTDDERAAVDGDLSAIDRLTSGLASQPTPCGKPPSHLHQESDSA